mmetsp:Transcript_96265/g.241307  ORF Transcript_96265/g.241307 Transcript_96265/m.241307 type:complete len:227 (-) Transcript_96265:689-1369(-)
MPPTLALHTKLQRKRMQTQIQAELLRPRRPELRWATTSNAFAATLPTLQMSTMDSLSCTKHVCMYNRGAFTDSLPRLMLVVRAQKSSSPDSSRHNAPTMNLNKVQNQTPEPVSIQRRRLLANLPLRALQEFSSNELKERKHDHMPTPGVRHGADGAVGLQHRSDQQFLTLCIALDQGRIQHHARVIVHAELADVWHQCSNYQLPLRIGSVFKHVLHDEGPVTVHRD